MMAGTQLLLLTNHLNKVRISYTHNLSAFMFPKGGLFCYFTQKAARNRVTEMLVCEVLY